jgi:peroxiredoxin
LINNARQSYKVPFKQICNNEYKIVKKYHILIKRTKIMKNYKIILSLIVILSVPLMFSSCTKKDKVVLKEGNWVGVLEMDKNDKTQLLPFNFTYNKGEVVITNADEKIIIKEIITLNDSVVFKLPVFKDEIRAKIISGDSLAGEYFHFGSKSKFSFPFYAKFGKTERFENAKTTPAADISGRWETTVQPGDSDQYMIIGEFKQNGNKLTGTFLTSSGDYRYLDGAVSGNKIMLSCLDGAHTLLFKADISKDGNLENGILIGGPTWKEKWIAMKNDKAELPDPEKQSAVKEGTNAVDFNLTDLDGKKVTLSEKYKGKAVILQIMGSWCPNCMDETRFFTEIYDTYKPKGLEIIGLCFESNNFDESKVRIQRFVSQLGAKYDFLYAGEVGKNSIFQALPFMKEFKGYPTTLYLDKNHNVKKVYTGFSGPGTGKHYEKQKSDIIQFIDKLLEQK